MISTHCTCIIVTCITLQSNLIFSITIILKCTVSTLEVTYTYILQGSNDVQIFFVSEVHVGYFLTWHLSYVIIFCYCADWDDSRGKKKEASTGAQRTVAWGGKGLCNSVSPTSLRILPISSALRHTCKNPSNKWPWPQGQKVRAWFFRPPLITAVDTFVLP